MPRRGACFHNFISFRKISRNRSAAGGLSLKRPLTMYYCTAAVFRDKPYMYMNGACTPFMYACTLSSCTDAKAVFCFQGAPSTQRKLSAIYNTPTGRFCCLYWQWRTIERNRGPRCVCIVCNTLQRTTARHRCNPAHSCRL